MNAIPLFETEGALPGFLGALRYEGFEAFEDAGLGVRLAYGSGLTRADVYLYDSGTPYVSNEIDSEEVETHFLQAYSNILEAAKMGGYERFQAGAVEWMQLPGDFPRPSYHWATFVFGGRHGVRNGTRKGSDSCEGDDSGLFVSHLMVRSDGGYINKIRYTVPLEDAEQVEGLIQFLVDWQNTVQACCCEVPRH
jgi:hypothetical protein